MRKIFFSALAVVGCYAVLSFGAPAAAATGATLLKDIPDGDLDIVFDSKVILPSRGGMTRSATLLSKTVETPKWKADHEALLSRFSSAWLESTKAAIREEILHHVRVKPVCSLDLSTDSMSVTINSGDSPGQRYRIRKVVPNGGWTKLKIAMRVTDGRTTESELNCFGDLTVDDLNSAFSSSRISVQQGQSLYRPVNGPAAQNADVPRNTHEVVN